MEKDWLDNLIEGAKLMADALDCNYTEVISCMRYNYTLGEETIDLINFNMEENDIHVTRELLKENGLYDIN